LEQLRNTVVAVREGAPIQLKEIATVEDSSQEITRIVRINGEPGIRLAVNKQSGTNTVEVARKVLREIERINQDLPQIHLTPIIDTSDYIERSITNVGTVMLYGGALAVIVLLFFLRSLRATAVITTAIPISIIATFVLMYFGGFTLNIMTLGGLALGIGMLVDSAIVVLENIFRLKQSGMEAESAAIHGSEEVAAAIIASTLTTLAVFFPLIFVRGMSGVMFKQLAYVVSFSLGCSLVVALSLVPMLAARLLPQNTDRGRTPSKKENRFFQRLEESYTGLLRFALNHRWLIIFLTLLVLAGSLSLSRFLGTELMPTTDEGEVRVYAEMEVGTRVEVVNELFEKIEAVVKREVPEIKNTVSYVGGTSWRTSGSHTGQLRIALKPRAERTRSSEEISRVLRRSLSGIPGVTIRTRPGRGLFLLRMGTGHSERVEVEIRGHDLIKAEALSRRVQAVVDTVDGVTDTQISLDAGRPEEIIIIDRQKASDMKLSVSVISDMLKTAISGTLASYFREAGDEIGIRVKLKDAEKMNLREILDLTINNRDGQPVVLRNVVHIEPQTGPVIIERMNQERIVTIRAHISGRDMGSVIRIRYKGH
jgi:HAE1 family hydrophobic/amphiphilic exporter-1